jgi:hypothetical protein
MRTIKWHKGVRNMQNKRDAKLDIKEVMSDEGFKASRAHFILLSTRAGLGGWKKAVEAVVIKTDIEMAKHNLYQNDIFWLTKAELRRAADLV